MTPQSRWMRAARTGGTLGLLPQIWMLTAGTWNPLRWGRQSDFYDVQARALLDGTFAMDQRVLGIESFARGDQHFMYFGPVPALIRLPVVLFTRSLDGRMAAASMFCALLVILGATMRLGWSIRGRVLVAETDELEAVPVSRTEAIAVALTMFSVIGGSSLLYASSRTWVYHEAILWGVALTLAAIVALLVWMDEEDINSRRSHRLLAVTSGLIMLALLARPSVAGGALAALALVAAGPVFGHVRAWRSSVASADGTTRLTVGLLVAAVAMPVVAYSIVNWLKFRRLLGVPFDQQGYTLLSEQRQDMLAANGGTLFNWTFLPTNITSYLRPDLIGIDGTFPFMHPRRPVSTIGSPFYDLIDLTAGLPTTMPLLLGLGLIGTWAVFRHPDDRTRPLRLVLAGCLLGTIAVLAIGYLANRYQSDFLPYLIVSAMIGLPVLTRWLQSLTTDRRRLRVLTLSLAPTLVAVGLLTNLAFGYSYQRVYSPSTHPDAVAGYLDSQGRVDGWLGDGVLARLDVIDRLPFESTVGDVAVIGDCAALYISDGNPTADGGLAQWRLAELAATNGGSRGTVTLSKSDPAVALASIDTVGELIEVLIEADVAAGVMTTIIVTPRGRQPGPDLPLRTDSALEWEIFADAAVGRLDVYLDGRFGAFAEIPVGTAVTTSIDVSSAVTAMPVQTPVCNRLTQS